MLIPLIIGGGLLVAALVAGANKRSQESAAAEPMSPALPITPGGFSVPGTAAAAVKVLPSDIQALVATAIGSANPQVMRDTANAIRAKYPEQASQLDNLAGTLTGLATAAPSTPPPAPKPQTDVVGPGGTQPKPASASPGIAQVTTPAKSGATSLTALLSDPALANKLAAAASQADAITALRDAAQAAGYTLSVEDISTVINAWVKAHPQQPTQPSAAPQLPSAPQAPGAPLAQQLNLALKYAKKGQKTEPIALVRQFQVAEGLASSVTAADGRYGTAIADRLVNKYDLVPTQPPMYWGLKNNYASIAPDKAKYVGWLQAKAAAEPQRRDEWLSASKQVK